jgi:hypothetical protein
MTMEAALVKHVADNAVDALNDAMWDRASDLLDDMEMTVLRAYHLAELLHMAGESLSDMRKRNAITAQCDLMQKELRVALDARAEVHGMVLGRVPS